MNLLMNRWEAGIMAFSHDITFCAGELVDCPKKESCYRYKEVDRFQPGEVFSMATLYKAACCEVREAFATFRHR